MALLPWMHCVGVQIWDKVALTLGLEFGAAGVGAAIEIGGRKTRRRRERGRW